MPRWRLPCFRLVCGLQHCSGHPAPPCGRGVQGQLPTARAGLCLNRKKVRGGGVTGVALPLSYPRSNPKGVTAPPTPIGSVKEFLSGK